MSHNVAPSTAPLAIAARGHTKNNSQSSLSTSVRARVYKASNGGRTNREADTASPAAGAPWKEHYRWN